MFLYWLAFAMLSVAVMMNMDRPSRPDRVAYSLVGVFFVIMIGLRYQVGGDWGNYFRQFAVIKGMGFLQVLQLGDPGYYLMNWFLGKLGGGVVWINLLCSIIVVRGLSYFNRHQPFPWLALLVALPYLIIVVSMGYTRQAAALGFAMMALTDLGKGKNKYFVLWIILGALFHKSALLLLPIAALSTTKNKLWTSLWVGVLGLIAVNILLLDSADDLWRNYVEADYQSQGGLIRVAMNAVPSVIFLLCRNTLSPQVAERKLWTWMALLSLITLPLVFVSSTAIDRVALYFIPIQLFVFSRFPYLAGNIGGFRVLTIAVIAYYALVQFVWLFFASHAFAWLPYDNYIFHGFFPSG